MLLLLTLGPARTPVWCADPVKNIPCEQIESFDLQNASFPIEPDGNAVQFTAGKACPVVEPGSSCDWDFAITTDRVLHPDPHFPVRLVVVNANHLTGSGAWDHLILFACEDGKPSRIFQNKYLYGAKVDLKNDSRFTITSGEWQQSDAACCPSGQKEELLVWNARKHAYDVTKTKGTKHTHSTQNNSLNRLIAVK